MHQKSDKKSVTRGKNGGTRPGAGRRAGSGFIALSKALARKYSVDGGLCPLDVMMGNMRFWALQGENYAKKIDELVRCGDTDDPATRDEARRLLNKFLAARQNAQECAKDAAPYMHPRYQSIQWDEDNPDKEDQIIEMLIPDTPAMEDRSYRDRPVARAPHQVP